VSWNALDCKQKLILNSIKDNKLGNMRDGEITLDYGFQDHLLLKILGKKLFTEYYTEYEKQKYGV
jgi:hypothetical protein